MKTVEDLQVIADNMSTQPRLLIVGDSFSGVKDSRQSWTCLLDDFDVVNLSQPGCSEYRVLQQLKTVDLADFDLLIAVHTSPNRIYINQNPLHLNSKTHQSCDLIYQDVVAQPASTFQNHVVWWFENVFDLEHAQTIHELLIDRIVDLTHSIPSLHVSFFDIDHKSVYNLNNIWKKYPGNINHLSIKGNQEVAEFIRNKLKEVQ